MYVTQLDFEQVINRFYTQSKYDLMLLFVSSFDGNDHTILRELVNNAKRIDRITGNRICFFYFIKDAFDSMNQNLTRWVKDLSDWEPLYGEGVSVTMETADKICQHFGLLRSTLPAFILVSKDRSEKPQVFSIHEYRDFESFLTPLNILHAYEDDRKSIISRYENEKRRDVVTREQVDARNAKRRPWIVALEKHERKKAKELSLGLPENAEKRESEIQKYKKRLADYPELEEHGEDDSVIYPQQELDYIRNKSIERLNISLNSNDGESMIEDIASGRGYFSSVLKIWELVRTRGARISRITENIRYQIHEHGFDVFISCKSQDYALAHALYDYLVANGFRPFLADTSIKEVGIDQYTALIGEVINVCQNMIVFATNLDYIETPYVSAEWHTFVNDINTGHKPDAKIVTILSPDIDVHYLPAWLRDKQCFTTENYKDSLLHFLNGWNNDIIRPLMERVQSEHARHTCEVYRLSSRHTCGDIEYLVLHYIHRLDSERDSVVHQIESLDFSCNPRELINLRESVENILARWEYDFQKIVDTIEHYAECEEEAWQRAMAVKSEEALMYYLKQYPNGEHVPEAKIRLNSYKKQASVLKHEQEKRREDVSAEIFSFSPSCRQEITSKAQPDNSYSYSNFWDRLFNRRTYNVYSSIFAPSEVAREKNMLVQVYLHLEEETEKVKALAKEPQKNAERRDYIPLKCKLKKGDKVDVLLNIYGETLLMSDKNSLVWQGSFTKCSFDYFVPKEIDVDELSCVAFLTVNYIPVGEMRFITKIVEQPKQLNPEVLAHQYNKIFISYAHQDEEKVKFLAEGFKLMNSDYFFDRHYLKTGDVFPQVIKDYIDSADLFILCWSGNAAKSEYVDKERTKALERAFPQVKPRQAAKLSIYPMSIEPRAELPNDMRDCYHFGEI